MRKLTLKLLSCVVLVAIPLLAHADSVDCSGVPHWNSDHQYKKGDRVWHHEGGNVYELYTCDKDKCVGAGSNEPGSGSTWKRRGLCKETPR
jgi:hypothetical protein